MRDAFYRAWDFLHFLSGDGSWRLRPLEEVVIEAVINDLSASIATLVRRQLGQAFFVERIPAGRINVLRFYRIDDSVRIREPGFSDKLFKVGLVVDGRNETAHVTFYEGHIFSVEFKHPSRFYAGKKIEIRSVAAGAPENTYTREIDEAEHGPSV